MSTNTKTNLLAGALLCFAAVILIILAQFAKAAEPPGVVVDVPQSGSAQSGIGLIHGWICGGGAVSVAIDGEAFAQVTADAPRWDVAQAFPECGPASGFSMAFNYGHLGPGEHLIEVHAGETALQSRFSVVGFEQPFISGNPELLGTQVYTGFYSLHLIGAWFPGEGERDLELQWSTAAQQFVIVANEPHEIIVPPHGSCGFSPPDPSCQH